ncbi:hypothetical protein JCM10908_001924 [Rhodotorula pacifica]|uniref:aromatic ring-hydroxylating oxygenase subunit alpha n=1 Tax=Rhodotorula pacifica TaxID=1495444 RepID=UPI00316BE2A9
MSSYLSSFLGRGSATKANAAEGVEHSAMPASFYTSDAVFNLEKRAIFSRMWLLCCHERYLNEPGKYQVMNIAAQSFFVIRGKDGEIRAFHNVCRHRGFPVVDPTAENGSELAESKGKRSILACMYHGWKYNTDGTLFRAPQFQDVPGFDPKAHSLFPLRVHIDKNGFVYANADMSEDGLSWEDQFGKFDEQERLQKVNWEDYNYELSWSMENAPYNWKVLVDNYSECLHCPFTHPDFVRTTDLDTYRVEGNKGIMAHSVDAKPGALAAEGPDADKFAFNFISPAASHTVTPMYWYHMRIVPVTTRSCTVLYDVYRHKDCTDEVFAENHAFFVRVESEDKMLCANVQKNLERGTYNAGPLHPERESGVIYFHKMHIKLLQDHFEKEKAAGHEIRGGKTLYRGKETAADSFASELESCGGSCGGGAAATEW